MYLIEHGVTMEDISEMMILLLITSCGFNYDVFKKTNVDECKQKITKLIKEFIYEDN